MKNKKTEKAQEDKLEKIKKDKESKTLEAKLIEKAKENPSMVKEMFMGIMKSNGPMYPPFLKKVEGNHITQALKTMDKQVDYDHDDRQKKQMVYCLLCNGWNTFFPLSRKLFH